MFQNGCQYRELMFQSLQIKHTYHNQSWDNWKRESVPKYRQKQDPCADPQCFGQMPGIFDCKQRFIQPMVTSPKSVGYSHEQRYHFVWICICLHGKSCKHSTVQDLRSKVNNKYTKDKACGFRVFSIIVVWSLRHFVLISVANGLASEFFFIQIHLSAFSFNPLNIGLPINRVQNKTKVSAQFRTLLFPSIR